MADGGRNVMKPVTILIPTYNGRHLLEKNLLAVVKCARKGDELMIVDDASSDDTIEWLTNTFKLSPLLDLTLTIIENETNLRFGASVNKGVIKAQHDYIFLLNNDVSPEPDVLKHLTSFFDDDAVFAVGCREIESNNDKKIGGKNKLWFERGLFMHARADEFSTGETAWASGGSALYDKHKWLKLGGFDADYYPAYWEDVDLSFRARARGWKVLFSAEAVVHHNHESTNNDVFGQNRIDDISWRNGNKFTWKNGTLRQKISHLLWKGYWFIRRAAH
jgi:GT2 family glycosyltransferase